MIRRLLQQNNSINHFQLIRNLSSIQNICINYTENKLNEDISNEIIAGTNQFAKENVKKQAKIKRLTQMSIAHRFRRLLRCTEEEANKIIKENKKLADIDPNKISNTIEFLLNNDISIKSIINNPYLLTIDQKTFKSKLAQLQHLEPKEINDLVPLLQVSNPSFKRIIESISKEKNVIPERNRIYYLSQRLNVEPSLVAKFIANRTFMFEISFERLVENLNLLQEYKIDPINILKDMWVFTYSPQTIRDRLERCKLAGKEHLRPWMVRCREEKLQNSLKMTKETKSLLGDLSLVEYISQRLGCDTETINIMIQGYPDILKCRAKRIKEILDYLLEDEKIEPLEILRVLRILTYSLDKIKLRMNELKSIGYTQNTLTIVCRSKSEYKKALNKLTCPSRRLILQSNSINHFKLIRSLSGIQNLCSNYTANNINEDISNEIIANINQIAKHGRAKKTKENMIKKFQHILQCTDEEATQIVTKNQKLIKSDPYQISDCIEFLFENNVSIKSIINHPWLLTMDRKLLETKLVRLKLLKPRDINDFVPLLQFSILILKRLIKKCIREREVIPEGNRIYYLSKKLNVEPSVVAKNTINRIFLFEINFQMLVENIDVLQEYKINSMNILRDAHVLRYSKETIIERLEKCKQEGKEILMPWMVKCTEEILENSIKLTRDKKRLLGDNSVLEYIAQRLNCSVEEVYIMAERYPPVFKVRVGKVKAILDYLLNEEKFTPLEVLRVIRILGHSLKTTKLRLNELKALGCRPSTLTIVCRSQNEYNKFVNQWIDRKERIFVK
ncbi:hypothetical protein PVAND_012558 [Polypedilum vanderplanki]|uniref:Transcription termination factor n=1 Tax=Polypedilum vanderplanki TaxID=319348 RepID=A0A9J6CMW5_POLVA|nr:hypothetical protein PVAND_012558 [Polypedilum vanderplanki]